MTATALRAPTDQLRDIRRNVPAAIALLAAVVVFFVAETVAAAAWKNPAYSYSDDFVSDLGVPGPAVSFKGHVVHSPLAAVLNAGFVINGALVVLAAALLLRTRRQGRLARWQFRLVIGYGLGLFIAASFPESPAWRFPLHALGATMIMTCGNLATFVTGRLGARLGLPTWLARAFMVLGAVGVIAFLLVQVDATVVDSSALPPNIGTLERFAAYPLIVTELVAGIALLVESARLRRRDLALIR
jgi:hypothetical membrane protein